MTLGPLGIHLSVVDLREHLSTGEGLRFSAEIYGWQTEKTGFPEYLQKACWFLHESPETSGSLPENVIWESCIPVPSCSRL